MEIFKKGTAQEDKAINEFHSYLNLSANENSMSRTAKKYLSTVAADRYYFESNNEGYSDFPEFVASGNIAFDELIRSTQDDLKEMFGAGYVNLNPLSGIHAMLMVLLTLTDGGDTVASLSPQSHGHFSTATIINRIGRHSVLLPDIDGEVDVLSLPLFIQETRAKMIYIDAMSYQHPFDIQRIRDAVGDDIVIVFDASHTLGLIAGGVFPNPFIKGADVICGNTHKTFPGPHRGIILAISQTIGECITEKGSNLYSTVQAATLLSMAVTVREMKVFAKEYASNVVKNAQILQNSLVDSNLINRELRLTDNHQVHIGRPNRESAVILMKALKDQGVLTHVCYGDVEGFYVRIGTQEITRRGMGSDEMRTIARFIGYIANGKNCHDEVKALNNRYTEIQYSFDRESEEK